MSHHDACLEGTALAFGLVGKLAHHHRSRSASGLPTASHAGNRSHSVGCVRLLPDRGNCCIIGNAPHISGNPADTADGTAPQIIEDQADDATDGDAPQIIGNPPDAGEGCVLDHLDHQSTQSSASQSSGSQSSGSQSSGSQSSGSQASGLNPEGLANTGASFLAHPDADHALLLGEAAAQVLAGAEASGSHSGGLAATGAAFFKHPDAKHALQLGNAAAHTFAAAEACGSHSTTGAVGAEAPGSHSGGFAATGAVGEVAPGSHPHGDANHGSDHLRDELRRMAARATVAEDQLAFVELAASDRVIAAEDRLAFEQRSASDRVWALQNHVNSRGNATGVLQNQLNALQSRVTALSDSNTGLKALTVTLSKDNSALVLERATLRSELSASSASVAGLTAIIAEHESTDYVTSVSDLIFRGAENPAGCVSLHQGTPPHDVMTDHGGKSVYLKVNRGGKAAACTGFRIHVGEKLVDRPSLAWNDINIGKDGSDHRHVYPNFAPHPAPKVRQVWLVSHRDVEAGVCQLPPPSHRLDINMHRAHPLYLCWST